MLIKRHVYFITIRSTNLNINIRACQKALVVKSPPANAEDIETAG